MHSDSAVPTARLQGSWLSLALTSRCRPGVWDLGWGADQWSSPHWLCRDPSVQGCLWVGALEMFVGHGGPCPLEVPQVSGTCPDGFSLRNKQNPGQWTLSIRWREAGLFGESTPMGHLLAVRKSGAEVERGHGSNSLSTLDCCSLSPLSSVLFLCCAGGSVNLGVHKAPTECPAPSRSHYCK